MVIYADILFLTNLYIDFFLLACVKQFLHLRATNLRLILGALTGGAFSLTALLPALPAPACAALSLLCAALMTAAAFAPASLFTLIKGWLSQWAFGFVFAGFFLLLSRASGFQRLYLRNGIVYCNLSPAMLFGFTLLAYLAVKIIQRFTGPREPALRFCKLSLSRAGKTAVLYAKADTGHTLREPFSGLPVVVAQHTALSTILPEEVHAYTQTGIPGNGLRLIPYESLGGGGLLPAFAATVRLTGQGEDLPCYVAVSSRTLSAGQFDALFSPELFPEPDAPPSSKNAHRLTRTAAEKSQGLKGNRHAKTQAPSLCPAPMETQQTAAVVPPQGQSPALSLHKRAGDPAASLDQGRGSRGTGKHPK